MGPVAVRRLTLVLVALVAAFAAILPVASHAGGTAVGRSLDRADPGRTFYLSCEGRDAAVGTSPDRPWRTLRRASRAPLQPGERLLLRRGCTWQKQTLDVHWAGTPGQPVRIGAYGDQHLPRPQLRNGLPQNVRVTGSFLEISDLSVSHDPVQRSSCGQPIGNFVGFEFTGGAHDVLLTRSRASGAMAGARLLASTSRIQVVRNAFVGNDVLQSMSRGRELGAWGVLVNSSRNDIAWNEFRGNRSVCVMANGRYASNSVELYGASYNTIHHNRSSGDRVFSELGSASDRTSTNNTYGYNLFVSALPSSRFITTRGAGDTSFGPVLATAVAHNTTFQTGPDSQGVVCGQGCGPDVLSLRANIIWAEAKALYADGPVTPAYNIFWNTAGNPAIQMEGRDDSGSLVRFPLGANNLRRAPRLGDPPSGDFLPSRSSPALGGDPQPPGYGQDLAGTALMRGGGNDIGAFERRSGGGSR